MRHSLVSRVTNEGCNNMVYGTRADLSESTLRNGAAFTKRQPQKGEQSHVYS
jgi:hypothetical protein